MTTQKYFLDEANPGIDISKLSEKSSKALTATCPDCSYSWSSSKRSIANGYLCPECKKRQQSFWNTTEGKKLLPYIVRSEGTENQNSEKTVDIQCPDCKTVLRRSIKQLYKETHANESFCGKCYSRPKVKTGELFFANYPEARALVQDSVEDDVLLQTNATFSFLKGCGHIDEVTPRDFLRNREACTVCVSKKKDDFNTLVKALTAPVTGEIRIPCQGCKKAFPISQRRLQRLHAKGQATYWCRECLILESSNKPLVSDLLPDWDIQWSSENEKEPSQVTAGSAYRAKLLCPEGHKWESFVYAIKGICPLCNPSSLEKELEEFITDRGIQCVRNTRQVIPPLEIDFYFPEAKLAVETNGLYWHSSKQVEKLQHYTKFKQTQAKGLSLLVIWEDDWIEKPDVVKRMILHRLGKSEQTKVASRKCKVAEIQVEEARQFLEENHIQGFKTSSRHIALKTDSQIVAVLSVTESGEIATINRYATAVTVQGGFTKLLAYYKKHRSPDVNRIVTFSDNSVSNGDLYAQSGFKMDKELPVDYMYLYQHRRVHKFNFRRSRFEKDPNLKYDERMSESQLAELNNIHKVHDYGKKRWVLDL